MSTVESANSVMTSGGALRASVQIAVPLTPTAEMTADASLEAAVQRVATLLYIHSHLQTPPDATDMGGGVFNVLV